MVDFFPFLARIEPPMSRFLLTLVLLVCIAPPAIAQNLSGLKRSLALHAGFDDGLKADFSRGDPVCYLRQGKSLTPCVTSEELKLDSTGGKFGGALWFPKKGVVRPQFQGEKVLGYNDQSWSATVSVWLKISPDEDLEPGYCDPVQIVGDDVNKGYIFLEWSKDETPRYFRYAIRPLFHIWNPTNVTWADIPFEKRPMVQVAKAPFSREKWTHVAFTVDQLNNKQAKPSGALYLDGQRQGAIENWDLTFGWDPTQVAIVLGAAYVGQIDDLAVFDRALNDAEVKLLFGLANGIRDLR